MEPTDFLTRLPSPPATSRVSKGDRFGVATINRVLAGPNYSLAIGLKNDKPQLFGWGQNANNVLGIGESWLEAGFPIHVEMLESQILFQIVGGLNHAMILCKKPDSSGGKLYSCGLGIYGRLGYCKEERVPIDPSEEDSWFANKPYRVMFDDPKLKVARVACGADHTLIISDHGQLYLCGMNRYGCLGFGIEIPCVWNPRILLIVAPIDNCEEFVVHAAAGRTHSVVCCRSGRVYTWGCGDNGRLGHGIEANLDRPKALGGAILNEHIIFVACGESHTCLIDQSSRLWAFGCGLRGCLGLGDDHDRYEPHLVTSLEGKSVVQVSCGAANTLCLVAEGEVYIWGTGDILEPKKLDLSHRILGISAGYYHSLLLASNGDILSWGRGDRYRLGHGDEVDVSFPKPIAELRGRGVVQDLRNSIQIELSRASSVDDLQPYSIISVACGRNHTLVLTGKHEVWGFGSNNRGQLGLGENKVEVLEPVLIDIPEKASSIAAGYNHSIVITTSGSVYVFGAGDRGQLGTGNVAKYLNPTRLPADLGNCIMAACSIDYSALLIAPRGSQNATAGDVWTFGSGDSGKLGLGGTQESVLQPKRVLINETVVSIATGPNHMLALTSSGSIYSWGAGLYGRLGTGKLTNEMSPVLITIPPKVVFIQVACGEFHCMALSTAHTVYIWGKSLLEQPNYLAYPTEFTMKLAIVPGEDCSKPIAIYCGLNNCAVVTKSKRLVIWGDNGSQQCCIPHPSSQVAPVIVEKIDDVLTVALGRNHVAVATRRGLFYTFGSSEKGKLGLGFTKKKSYGAPQPVSWESAPLETAEPDISSAVNAEINLFSQLQSHDHPSFKLVQLALKNEKFDDKDLENLDEDLTIVMGRHLKWIQDFKSLSHEYKLLSKIYELTITRIKLVGLSSPWSSLGPTTTEIDYIHQNLTTLLPIFSEVVEALAIQPAYWITISEFMSTAENSECYLTLLDQIYGDLSSVRNNAFYLTILRGLAVQEIQACQNASELFSGKEQKIRFDLAEETSLFANALKTYIFRHSSVMERVSTKLLKFGGSSESLVDILAYGSTGTLPPGWVFFASSVEHYQSILEERQTNDEALAKLIESPKDLQAAYSGTLNYLKFICKTINLDLPSELLVIFRQALAEIQRHELFSTIAEQQLDFHKWKPILRVIINEIVSPILNNAYEICEMLYFHIPPEVDAARVYHNLAFIAQLLSDCTLGFISENSAHHRAFLDLAENLVSILAADHGNSDRIYGNFDHLDTQLTLSFFVSHLEYLKEPLYPPQLPIDWWLLMHLTNQIHEYGGKVTAMSTFDPLILAVEGLSSTKCIYKCPYDASHIYAMADASRALNPKAREVFMPDVCFLFNERNLMYDPLVRAPIPQKYAIRQKARTTTKSVATLSLIHRMPPIDEQDFRHVICEAIKISPIGLDVRSFAELVQEFHASKEFFLRTSSSPDFAKASIMDKAATAITAKLLDKNPKTFMLFVAAQIAKREEHSIYLKTVREGDDHLDDLEKHLELALPEKLKAIKQAIISVQSATIDGTLATACNATNKTPYIWYHQILENQSNDRLNVKVLLTDLQRNHILVPSINIDESMFIEIRHPGLANLTVPVEIHFHGIINYVPIIEKPRRPHLFPLPVVGQ